VISVAIAGAGTSASLQRFRHCDIVMPIAAASDARRTIHTHRPSTSTAKATFEITHHHHGATHIPRALRKANRERKKNGNKLIPYFTVHTLRHWFISWALTRRENPLTEAELIKIVGHADFATTRKVYLHITADGDTSRKMRETLLFGDVAN